MNDVIAFLTVLGGDQIRHGRMGVNQVQGRVITDVTRRM
jgi:hypothetical protein